MSILYRCRPTPSLDPSPPREAEGEPPRTGFGDRRQLQSFAKPYLSREEWCVVSNPPSEQRNDEGQMNSAILLVDVASASRDSWKSFLQSQNYEVFTAEDGESALRECLRLQPDLVLLHDTLPDVGGFDPCRRMKGNPLNQHIPIVLIKASSGPADAAP